MIKEYQKIFCDYCNKSYTRNKNKEEAINDNNIPLTVYVIDDDHTGESHEFCCMDCMTNFIKSHFGINDYYKIYSYSVFVTKESQ